MRVNITYSVELEEVSEIVKKLLLETTEQLDSFTKEFPKVSSAVKMENEKKALSLLNDCRGSLAKIDHGLFDCESILSGYQETLVQIRNQEKAKMGGPSDDAPESR
jgi:septation ring formation regulator EzrA